MARLADHGPRYAETDLSALIAEPFNTGSNLIFLLILIYWVAKTGLNFRRYPFITLALPVLAVGFIGGTIYHATRSHFIWLFLDFMPILLLCLAAAFRFWQLYLKRTLLAVFLTFAVMLAPRLAIQLFDVPLSTKIGFGYSGLALGILLPAFLLSFQNQRVGIGALVAALISFSIAITFRTLDLQLANIFPMGTHFLWHIFGGISTFYLLKFVYLQTPQKKRSQPKL